MGRKSYAALRHESSGKRLSESANEASQKSTRQETASSSKGKHGSGRQRQPQSWLFQEPVKVAAADLIDAEIKKAEADAATATNDIARARILVRTTADRPLLQQHHQVALNQQLKAIGLPTETIEQTIAISRSKQS